MKRITGFIAAALLVAGALVGVASPAMAESTVGCTDNTSYAAKISNEIDNAEPGGGGLQTDPIAHVYRYTYISTCTQIRVHHVTFTDNYQPPPDWDTVYVVNASTVSCWVQWTDSAGNKIRDLPSKPCYDGVDSSSYVVLASGLTSHVGSTAYFNILFRFGHPQSSFNFVLNTHLG